MPDLQALLDSKQPANLPAPLAAKAAPILGQAAGLDLYPESLCALNGILYALGRDGARKSVLRAARDADGRAVSLEGLSLRFTVLPADHTTAARLRREAPFLGPRLVGTATSMGLGDRLGIATPGHLRAVRGTGVVPYLAQQSIREMERTARTPDDVMDCATFGALEAGWTAGFGSDADHLKTPADVDYTMAAGFTMFTIDPREHVENEADAMAQGDLEERYAALPWDRLESGPAETRARYAGRQLDLGDRTLPFSAEALLRAAVKYGRAVAHTVMMYRYVAAKAGARPFEFEMSVDETDSPTTTQEHYYFASELHRLGARWVSLAPRFIGRFEKGVDYIGDLEAFEAAYIEHCRVAEAFGKYKLSIHSGSDKFSVYGICARHTQGRVHVKTAGTSYLEALRTVAVVDPDLFLEILAFARERYEEDRHSYHVSADLAKVIPPAACRGQDLAAVLDHFDTREALHVTFGSVLTAGNAQRFKPRLFATLRAHEAEHYEIVARHIRRHLEPVVQAKEGQA